MKQAFCSTLWMRHVLFSAFLLVLMVATGGCGGRSRSRPLTSLSEPDRVMLNEYESIRAALAQNDFQTARRRAIAFQKTLEAGKPSGPKSPVAESVAKLAGANGIDVERDAFRNWSTQVITLTTGVAGFYVIHCPIPGCGDWLQTNGNVDNPYMGKAMRDCGEVQK